MKQVYYNVLVDNPRYRRLVMIVSAFIVLMTAGIIFLSLKTLNDRKDKYTPEKYTVEKKRVTKNAYMNIGFGLMTIVFINLLAAAKRKQKIVLTADGVEQQSIFGSKKIKWEEIKDLKLINPNSGLERCRIKGRDKEIIFSPFFLEKGRNYTVTKDGVFDEHNKEITGKVRKSRIYKEIDKRRK